MNNVEEFRIGPFSRGITTGELADADNKEALYDIVNFNIGVDGTLLSRKPLKRVLKDGQSFVGERFNGIGYYLQADGILYIIVNTLNGVKAVSQNGVVTTITDSNSHVALQYGAKLWVVCYNGASGSWTPAGGFITVSGMPQGVTAVIKNERLLVGSSDSSGRVTYSSPGDLTKWIGAGGGFFDVRAYDGGYISKLVLYNDQVVIFKDFGIWSLAFTADPGEGALRIMEPWLGAPDPFAVVADSSFIYFFNSGKAYRLANNSVQIISNQVAPDLRVVSTVGRSAASSYNVNLWVSFVSDTQVVFKVEDKYYVWNTITEAWTRYSFQVARTPSVGTNPENVALQPGPVLVCPDRANKDTTAYVSGGLAADNVDYYEWAPRIAVGNAEHEEFKCSFVTKGLIFSATPRFKRLMHWGIDLLHFGAYSVGTNPVVVAQPVTWNQVHGKTWNQLASNTWNEPLGPNVGFRSTSLYSNYPTRSYIKVDRSTRFRRINFLGSFVRTTQPTEVYTLTAFVRASQLVTARET